MAHEVRGDIAVTILRDEDVIKEFADANKPIPMQILSRLRFFLNKDDDFAIKKEYRDEGDAAGGAMLRIRLMQRYSDQPNEFTLKQFIDVLDHFETNVTLRNLLCSKCKYVATTEVSHSDSKTDKDIKAYLQFMCENVRKVWGLLLSETSLEKCYVAPEIVEEEMGEYGKRRKKATGKSVTNYKELFDNDTLGDRIIIEGDPGMGKTTYVNKLALDWTWDKGSKHYSDETKFLQSNFTTVFIIPLRSLNGSRASTFAQAASRQLGNCGSWLISKYETKPTKCLLILDAFDEYDRSCQEIDEIINGSKFPQLNVIVTTRPSHLDRLPIKNQWLAITGLTTPEKQETFLIKQGWDKLQEGDMNIQVLSTLGTLWHTPLYLAMLCVLYKAKKVTRFDPKKPNCFYVLVKLFTEHMISRKAKEGTLKKEVSQLKSEDRTSLKSCIQKCAFDQFSESHPSIADIVPKTGINCHSENLELAGQLGLLVIREEQSPVTGESEESVSFVHQLFLEYYAAVEFGTLLNSCTEKDGLLKLIKEKLTPTDSPFCCLPSQEKLSFTDSPFSYFLAAECKEYKEMLVDEQKCEDKYGYKTIYINNFPWLPEILISKFSFDFKMDGSQKLRFYCGERNNKSFFSLDYVKELCSIVKPRIVLICHAFLGYHDQSLDDIISMVNELELEQCNLEHTYLKNQYRNLTTFKIAHALPESIRDGLTMLEHFPNLQTLSLSAVEISNNTMNLLLCDLLKKMDQLQLLELWGCFKSPQSVQHIIKLAETIEISSLCHNLKYLGLNDNILDNETESSSDILMRAISKCVQLEIIDISYCQIKVQSLDIIKEVLLSSTHLKNHLKILYVHRLNFIHPHTATKEDLVKSDIKLIVPGFCVID